MDSFFDTIQRLLSGGKDSTTDDPGFNVDRGLDKKPEQGTLSGLLMHPDTLMQRLMGGQNNKDPANVTDEQGNIVDYRPGGKDPLPPLGQEGVNPFESLLSGKGNGPGTISGFIARMLSPQRERDVTEPSFSGTPTVGGGDKNAGTPGTGVDPALNPVRTKNQRVPGLASTEVQGPPPPPDYGMPNALDPQQIEELRKSLLTQAGQMDPNNPNGLAGRMGSPNAPSDMGRQGQEAVGIADSIRGFDGVKKAKIKATVNDPNR